jgi:hypothetical protein
MAYWFKCYFSEKHFLSCFLCSRRIHVVLSVLLCFIYLLQDLWHFLQNILYECLCVLNIAIYTFKTSLPVDLNLVIRIQWFHYRNTKQIIILKMKKIYQKINKNITVNYWTISLYAFCVFIHIYIYKKEKQIKIL